MKKVRDFESGLYYKLSKSNPSVAKLCYEGHFKKYDPDTIVRSNDYFLSFVQAENVISCMVYGDQLTEIIIDPSHPLFEEIADEEMESLSSGLGELRARAVIAGKSYSLSEPETIERIIQMTSESKLKILSEIDADALFSVAQHLEKLGFYQSLDYWNKRLEEYRHLSWNEINQRMLEKKE